MAIKTISLEVDAYDILCRARMHPRESFSRVIRRARWDGRQFTGAKLLAFSRERAQLGSALSDVSLAAIGKAVAHRPATVRSRGPRNVEADAYMVDLSYLLELEAEIAERRDGPAMTYLANHPFAVYRVCVITAGDYMGLLAAADADLGHQVLAQFESTGLSAMVAERYAADSVALVNSARTGKISPSNDLWVGCAAAEGNSPLLTWRPEAFDNVSGIQTVTF